MRALSVQLTMNADYVEHLEVLRARWDEALELSGYGAAILLAGDPMIQFLDDATAPFRPNPLMAQWLPHNDLAGSALLVRRGQAPEFHFYCPTDYWHAPPELPAWLQDAIDTIRHESVDGLQAALGPAAKDVNRVALFAPQRPTAFDFAEHNPADLLARLSFQRARKTAFEIVCLREASRLAAAGHRAAAAAFYAGASEIETLHAFLSASGQVATGTPYNSIVAFNRHAAVLPLSALRIDRPRTLPQPAHRWRRAAPLLLQ